MRKSNRFLGVLLILCLIYSCENKVEKSESKDSMTRPDLKENTRLTEFNNRTDSLFGTWEITQLTFTELQRTEHNTLSKKTIHRENISRTEPIILDIMDDGKFMIDSVYIGTWHKLKNGREIEFDLNDNTTRGDLGIPFFCQTPYKIGLGRRNRDLIATFSNRNGASHEVKYVLVNPKYMNH